MSKQYTCDDLIFDIEKMSVSTGRLERSLNYNECLLFKAFLDNANQVIDKETLKQSGWPDTIVTDSSLQKSVQKLRLAIAISDCVELRTIAGVGYMLYCSCAGAKVSTPNRRAFNSLTLAKASLAFFSIVLVLLSFFNFSRVTNTHLVSYLHEDYEFIEINHHKVLKQKATTIPPELESMIHRSECDCFYFVAETEGIYTLSVYENAHQRSENYLFEMDTLPKLIKDLG
ncbi:winged helix-turn-helix domain-containing protein [Vibrio campbellii]|uniref:winged helix-turn-helix domain-containing protein n=1 Tax=Vibrio campbellii TaxID=680 RepID=UPI000CD362BD|nr:winged helix-turn-helix domain-containing protein [Vibrio campbellii]AUV88370.1 transcriptional regulator [Vibrio campbellii]